MVIKVLFLLRLNEKSRAVTRPFSWQGLMEDVRTLVMAEPQMQIARIA